MMVDTLTRVPFETRIGKNVTVEAAEAELTLEIVNVKENPLAAGPNSKRTPFSVVLRGPESPCLSDGSYHLRADDEDSWRLENVYLNRIIPLANSDGTGAFYQLVFG
jgi:hypothetical protein